MRAFQESGHGLDHDYVSGSPHLKHRDLRAWIVGEVVEAVAASARSGHRPRVLEVGAGHGPLTEHLVAAGADVVVTEMSEPSVATLADRFAGSDRVAVVHDPTGELPVDGDFDAVVYVSVLHHIPDYVAAVRTASDRIRPGGALVSFQDPLWYPRRPRWALLAAKAVYLSWRVTRGDWRRGIATTLRQLRGIHDETNPSDMTEYHVMRSGVDEAELADVLGARFDEVRLLPYWSTQGTWGQYVGRRVLPANTFGLVATGRVPAPSSDAS